MMRLVAAFILALLPWLASAQTPNPPLPDNATLLHLTEQAQRLVTRDRLRWSCGSRRSTPMRPGCKPRSTGA